MRTTLYLVVFGMLVNLTIKVLAQEDTTKQDESFKYLFKQSERKKEKVKKDTISLSDFYDMSLEELQDLKATGVSSELEEYINSLISVSTQKSLPSRYSPNIVTLVTEEEIESMGARDLIDVLRLVPGFHFAQDSKGNVGLGIRGNWAAEGKVLIMMNGQEINEHYNAHTYFGNHFPVDMIKRIEIIRGPGSAIHGGFAEFGVINIVTKKPEDFSGAEVGLNQGAMGEGVTRGKFNMYLGNKWKNFDLSFFMTAGSAQRRNRQHYAFFNPTIDSAATIDSVGVGAYKSLAGESDLDNFMSNFDLNWGNFSFSSILDYYATTDVTTLNSKKERPLKYGYFSMYNQFMYKFRITPKLTITPKLNFNVQTPVEENTPYADALLSENDRVDTLAIAVMRARLRLDINYNVSHRVNILAGIDNFQDNADNADTISALYAGKPPNNYSSTAFYGEAIFRLPVFHLFAGVRYETNAQYESAFSPRIGITKKFNKFHMKFLATDAYRLPTLGNIYYSFDGTYQIDTNAQGQAYIHDLGRGLEPEKTLVLEAEAGYQFSDKTFMTVNIFDMTIRDPIVYVFYQDENIKTIYNENAGIEVYRNYEKSGTRGFEIDFRFQDKWGFLNANYSYYSVKNKPKIDAYSVSNFNRIESERKLVNENYLLAFPRHKLNINWLYKIKPNFSVNVNSSFIGPRYGYDVDIFGPGKYDVTGKLIKRRFTYLVNFFFRYENLFTDGLSAGLGVNDVFNKGLDYLQPYFGLQPPLPGPSREIKFTLKYQLPFNKKNSK